jgi:hypothetical protein
VKKLIVIFDLHLYVPVLKIFKFKTSRFKNRSSNLNRTMIHQGRKIILYDGNFVSRSPPYPIQSLAIINVFLFFPGSTSSEWEPLLFTVEKLMTQFCWKQLVGKKFRNLWPALPDGIFSYQKSQFCIYILAGLGMENILIFKCHFDFLRQWETTALVCLFRFLVPGDRDAIYVHRYQI